MKTLALIHISTPAMAETKIPDDSSFDDFFDAMDDFPPSELIAVPESEESVDLPQIVRLNSVENGEADAIKSPLSSDSSLSSTLRRRSSIRIGHRKISIVDANDSILDDLSAISEVIQVSEAITPRERRNKILSSLKDHDKVQSDSPRLKSGSDQISSKYDQNHVRNEKSASFNPPTEDLDGSSSNFLIALAGFIIKAIGFQISLLISFFTFPFWLLHWCFMLVTDPFQLVKRAKNFSHEKLSRISGALLSRVSPLIYKQLTGPQSVGRYVVRFSWGFFWSFYVFFVLFGFLVTSFVVGGIAVRYFVEEPIRMEENLNFDYTKPNPVAYVPLMPCDGVCCGFGGKEMVAVGKHVGGRVVPINHKLQVTVSLMLPESDYNRKLGVFQVRVDFLSVNGKGTATSRHPCMLRFKSLAIRLLETFIKSGPLLAGYSSESQLLNLRMTGFTEGTDPTSCLKVVLEQRAEFRTGAGIPEIYASSLVLESELPLFKRIIWNWKKTIFIWISLGFFTMELFFILICCRPVIIPKARANPRPRLREGSANRT
ncbi:seipin-2-like [Magnolia sinica]|uniref:seipin-2-like n=1 Tax=Magnolia sinica TaxID=86752 RepID=UPI0026593072|nr:seipin-2-like [Magnolia sinica]